MTDSNSLAFAEEDVRGFGMCVGGKAQVPTPTAVMEALQAVLA